MILCNIINKPDKIQWNSVFLSSFKNLTHWTFFHFLFGNKENKILDFKNRGAIILNVRCKGEYDNGVIPGSKNISLHLVQTKIASIKKWNKPVICCCASGMRSSGAARILRQQGIEAINGGN